jgi:hypothetical protein
MNNHWFRHKQILFIGPYRAMCSCGWKGRRRGWDTIFMAADEWERHQDDN